MAPRQALFDTPLAPYQPVHRCVELILVDRLQLQDLAEGGDRALRVQGASGGQFGAGVDDAGDNHGDDEIAPATGRTSDEGMQAELLEGAEDGGDMAVRVAAQAAEGGLGIDQGFAFESSADEIDDVVGEVGDVAEGFMLDLALWNFGLGAAACLTRVLHRPCWGVGTVDELTHTTKAAGNA